MRFFYFNYCPIFSLQITEGRFVIVLRNFRKENVIRFNSITPLLLQYCFIH